MPELNIRLQIDPETGKKNLIIEYESDADALPMEHEDEHRQLVDALVEGGMLRAEELGKVVVRREATAGVEIDEGDEQAADERESVEQSS